ncbi:MAG: arginine--tRNA ligase [Sphingomonadales bacterium]
MPQSKNKMRVIAQIKEMLALVLDEALHYKTAPEALVINNTKPEFEGDYTLVLFSLAKPLRLAPEKLGEQLGELLVQRFPEQMARYTVIKGFLNLTLTDTCWLQFLDEQATRNSLQETWLHGKKVMVEYSSPNTNKPLHLGHLRNIFLGWSVAEILKNCGAEVIKTCVVNDRGIHICKSMIAWQLFANGATPLSTDTKGDHFVGDYYVKFNDELKRQIEQLMASGRTKQEAEKEAPIMKATQQMLLDWEAGKPEVLSLWNTMNGWVYEGFEQTYRQIGADFQKTYYESNTYLLGKKFVSEGLAQGVFFTKEDGSTWIDLTAEGLDQKLVLRGDGTSVYITQDLGLAQEKYNEFAYDQSIYVIADEQNYHMKVLQLILEKLQKPYAKGIFHLSYGMVELPSGRMKSREGTVVDADDIVAEMIAVARRKTEELGKVKDFTAEELESLYRMLALGALKFFLLRVDPKKKMIFNPEESIDFQGFTGPFVQYTHARICSLLKKEAPRSGPLPAVSFLPAERELLLQIAHYPVVLEQAVSEQNPSVLAIYAFTLAKSFNSFYNQHSVMQAESAEKKQLRLILAQQTARLIDAAMGNLGIAVPQRM